MKKLLISLTLLLSCDKEPLTAQNPVQQTYKGSTVFYNKAGKITMRINRLDQEGNRTIIIDKKLLLWLNDSTFILKDKP